MNTTWDRSMRMACWAAKSTGQRMRVRGVWSDWLGCWIYVWGTK